MGENNTPNQQYQTLLMAKGHFLCKKPHMHYRVVLHQEYGISTLHVDTDNTGIITTAAN